LWRGCLTGSGLIVLATVLDDQPQVLVVVTSDLVAGGYDAAALARELARIIRDGGGGRADVAQAGGHDTSRLGEALSMVRHLAGTSDPS
jgi:alanyl-tRNA synthetase